LFSPQEMSNYFHPLSGGGAALRASLIAWDPSSASRQRKAIIAIHEI
jgi:hypothetical protein